MKRRVRFLESTFNGVMASFQIVLQAIHYPADPNLTLFWKSIGVNCVVLENQILNSDVNFYLIRLNPLAAMQRYI